MAPNRFLVVGVKTAEREWFALSNPDSGHVEVGVDQGVGRTEAELRRQLRDLGLSDADIEERFRKARQRMPRTSAAPATKH